MNGAQDKVNEISERWFGVLASTKSIPFAQAKSDIQDLITLENKARLKAESLSLRLAQAEKDYNTRLLSLGERLYDECRKVMTEWSPK